MKEILLATGAVVLVDDADYEYIEQFKWHPARRGGVCYAVRVIYKEDGKRTRAYMHRDILGAFKGIQVDHIDGNGLNNQRNNLRLCNTSENHANQGLLTTNKSGFKGVSWDSERGAWRAYIKHHQRHRHLGRYHAAEEAARAYDKAARELFGEFARTNFVEVINE